VVVGAEMAVLAQVIQVIVEDQAAVAAVTKRQQVVRQLMVRDLQAELGRTQVQNVQAVEVVLEELVNQAVQIQQAAQDYLAQLVAHLLGMQEVVVEVQVLEQLFSIVVVRVEVEMVVQPLITLAI
jgi:hypothetical protein